MLPTVFEYDNYRNFLKDIYAALKAKDKKFSFRYFARIAGFNSHNFLRLVMRGESDLSEESIAKFSRAFKFNKEESQFFRNLVLFNQARTSAARERYAQDILRSRIYRRIHPLHEAHYLFFKHWYFSVVREVVALPGFKEDPEKIGRQIIPHISAEDVKKSIREMLKMGLLKREEDGRLVQSVAVLATSDEVSSSYITHWHREYLRMASESIDRIPRTQRDISAVSFGFSQANFKTIKEIIQKFRRDIVELASRQQSKDVLLQFNMQIFPIAQIEMAEDLESATRSEKENP